MTPLREPLVTSSPGTWPARIQAPVQWSSSGTLTVLLRGERTTELVSFNERRTWATGTRTTVSVRAPIEGGDFTPLARNIVNSTAGP